MSGINNVSGQGSITPAQPIKNVDNLDQVELSTTTTTQLITAQNPAVDEDVSSAAAFKRKLRDSVNKV
jgi:hypothetical protein